MDRSVTVGILLFDEVEVLDFAGPFEVFSVSQLPNGSVRPFLVSTVSENGQLIHARNGLKVQTDYGFGNAPEFDVLVIPGGPGAREREVHNPSVIEWIKGREARVSILASVCTGAFLLAKAGLLNGKKATTHWASLDRFAREFPGVTVRRDVRYVDEGRIITSGGISAGIDMALHIVAKICGVEVAQTAARRMEYDWQPERGGEARA
ncbi:DJ-1/PfpI family protein [Alicyclobacillus macrosporangiidus]|uniref:DJ-1/PfpI family protein n=1 Tax=Alicyclobacillus macrosporangiidus TaxID=392015 RepID=A0A1I7HDN2_9BACL|nr:DJ-1/PfpI family protein [Alicyclobacillus macrosporangiidus]SFU58596.1 DJ-1/PfpI family protein [Alicyclobacillus macrosporangiidus]